MFDSPFAFCPKCKQMVLLDQTQRECKEEHACGDIECPLLTCFTGYDFKSSTTDKKRDKRHGSRQ